MQKIDLFHAKIIYDWPVLVPLDFYNSSIMKV